MASASVPDPERNPWVPRHVFLTKGVGRHREKLSSFEMALRVAQIHAYNLVMVSSILPPGCQVITRRKGLERLSPGQITFVVMSKAATNEPNRLLGASVGVAIPADKKQFGYLSEHHAFGQAEAYMADYAEDLAAEMLARAQGVEFDPDASWDEKRELWRIDGRIVRTRNVTQTARGDKEGRWTTVVAAAAFIL